MSVAEIFWRVMAEAEPLMPYLLTVVIATAIVLPIMLGLAKGLWVDQRRFSWLGLFLGLRTGESVRLACSWSRFVLALAFLIAFRKLSLEHYLLFAVVGVIYCFSLHDMARIPRRLFWVALEFVGLLSCNLICGYIRDVGAGAMFWVIYIMMGIFMALFGCYLFFTEINDISAGRRTDIEQAWQTEGLGDEGDDR